MSRRGPYDLYLGDIVGTSDSSRICDQTGPDKSLSIDIGVGSYDGYRIGAGKYSSDGLCVGIGKVIR